MSIPEGIHHFPNDIVSSSRGAEDIRVTLKSKGFVWNEEKKAYEKPAPLAPAVPAAEPQPVIRDGPLGSVRGEETRRPRTTICITAYRVRLQDADNNAGGCKYLIDGLRHAKIIADDSPDHIELVTKQIKVATKAEEGTEIVITEEPA